MGKVTPIIRSLEYVKTKYPNHYVMDITAYWQSWGKVVRRLFGCIELLLVSNSETIGIQSILKEHIEYYQKETRKNKELKVWLTGGRRFLFHCWYKESNQWKVDELEITPKEME